MKQGWKKWIAPVAIAVGAAALAACGSSSSTTSTTDTSAGGATTGAPAGGKTLVVSADLPLTGSSKAASDDTVNAINLLLDNMGHKAGPYTIVFKPYDNATAAKGAWDPAQCLKNAQDHVANTDEVAVMGTYNSGCAKVEVPVLNQADSGAGMLMISHANTNPGLTIPWEPGEPDKYYPTGKRNYGRIVVRDDIQGPAGARLAKELGYKNCLVLNDTQTYGVGVAKGFIDGAKAAGGPNIVDNVGWDSKQSSYRSIFEKYKGKIDCVYLAGIEDNNGLTVVKDKVAVLGPNTDGGVAGGVGLITPDGFAGYPALDPIPEWQGANLTFAGKSTSQLKLNPVGGKFLTDFNAKFGHDPASPYSIYGAAAMQLILACVAASDGTRADVIKQCFSGNVKVAAADSLLGKDIQLKSDTGDVVSGDLVYMKMIGGVETYQKDLAQ